MDNNIVNSEFKVWVSEISKKYRQAQIKAAISVNSEMLKFYFELGKEIANNSFKAKYGSKFYFSSTYIETFEQSANMQYNHSRV